jgi:hypothetical protein
MLTVEQDLKTNRKRYYLVAKDMKKSYKRKKERGDGEVSC